MNTLTSGSHSKLLRSLLVVGVATVLLLVFMAAMAAAATPQDIYNDYVKNGKLTGDYTQAELAAVANDPLLAQYADPGKLDELQKLVLTSERTVFPFTGAQMLLVLVGGVALVLLGFVLRRGGRQEKG